MDPRWKASHREGSWHKRTAGEMTTPWWQGISGPGMGNQRVSTDPDAWMGTAMLNHAIQGGPAVHVANWDGRLLVPYDALVGTLQKLFQVRAVHVSYQHDSHHPWILLASDKHMFRIISKGPNASLKIVTTSEDDLRKAARIAETVLRDDAPDKGFVYALAKSAMGGYFLQRIGAAGNPVERDNYDAETLASFDHVKQDFGTDAPCGRLVIMAGAPGTGKTFLVRSLLGDVTKAAFVLVPPHMVRDLGSPEMLPALVTARSDGLTGPIVLVIEDADQVLVNRNAGDMSAISSLLNLGDGILGSALDVRILATTNAAKIEMDPATRRPGRLCSYMEVRPLKAEHAARVLHRLTGKSVLANRSMTLAEVYSKGREMGWVPPPKETPAPPRHEILGVD